MSAVPALLAVRMVRPSLLSNAMEFMVPVQAVAIGTAQFVPLRAPPTQVT